MAGLTLRLAKSYANLLRHFAHGIGKFRFAAAVQFVRLLIQQQADGEQVVFAGRRQVVDRVSSAPIRNGWRGDVIRDLPRLGRCGVVWLPVFITHRRLARPLVRRSKIGFVGFSKQRALERTAKSLPDFLHIWRKRGDRWSLEFRW